MTLVSSKNKKVQVAKSRANERFNLRPCRVSVHSTSSEIFQKKKNLPILPVTDVQIMVMYEKVQGKNILTSVSIDISEY